MELTRANPYHIHRTKDEWQYREEDRKTLNDKSDYVIELVNALKDININYKVLVSYVSMLTNIRPKYIHYDVHFRGFQLMSRLAMTLHNYKEWEDKYGSLLEIYRYPKCQNTFPDYIFITH